MVNVTGIRLLISNSSHRMHNVKYLNQIEATIRSSFTCITPGRDYSTRRTSTNNLNIIPPRSSNTLLVTTHFLNHRSYSSSSSTSNHGENIPKASSSTGFDGNDLIDKIKDTWHSSVNIASQTQEKAKETFSEVTPQVEQLLNNNPYLRDVIVPIGGTMIGTIIAFAILPRFFRRFHKYSSEGPGAILPVGSLWAVVPYEKSFWGALEVPVKYLITFMAFSQIGVMVAPTTIASQYLVPVWRGAVVLSFVWFLQRWKTNIIARALAMKVDRGVDRDKLLTLDKISSVGLFVLGGMALAEACGVAVQSILTVGGIGGVATAFAARDIFGNILSGLSIQLSQPFSIGDTIKAGSVEGKVMEMGLTTTSLLSAEKFPIVVPNSLFSSQAIVNKSRAGWRVMVSKIPVQIDEYEKIPQISEEIKNMMKGNSNVFLEKEQPYCYLSRVERSFAELTLGCNLKTMSKDKLFAVEQDVVLQSVQIIKKHGATLGNSS